MKYLVYILIIVSLGLLTWNFLISRQVSSLEVDFLKEQSKEEIINNNNKKIFLKNIDSLKIIADTLNKELLEIKKINSIISVKLKTMENNYNNQKKEIISLKKQNENNKIHIPDNIDNLWK